MTTTNSTQLFISDGTEAFPPNSSVSINYNGFVLAGDLNTATPITATISQSGISTTNANGFDILSKLNMNDQNIDNVNTINSTTGFDLTLASQTGQVILNAGDNVGLTAGENFSVNTNATTGIISLTAGDYMNLTTTNGLNMNLKNIVNSTGLTTSNGNIDIIAQTDDINLQSTTGMSLSVNNGGLNLTSSGAGITLSTDQQIDMTATGGNINMYNTLYFKDNSSPLWDTFLNTGGFKFDIADLGNLVILDAEGGASFYLQSANGTASINPSSVSIDSAVGGNAVLNLNSAGGTTTLTLNNGINTNTINSTGYTTKNSVQNATHYLNFSDSSSTGVGAIQKTAGISCNPSTNSITATTFNGLLSTGGLVYLSTGSQSITGSASATNISLTGIFNSTYKNYRIVLYSTTQVSFTAYPAYSLQAFLGTGTLPTTASLYGFEMISNATTIVSPVYTASATISSSPLVLAVSQLINHHTIIEVENVGFTATATQSIGLKCKSFYSNPGISGASDRSILTTNVSGSTITGLTIQQSNISVGNNMTIGWTIYGYKIS